MVPIGLERGLRDTEFENMTGHAVGGRGAEINPWT